MKITPALPSIVSVVLATGVQAAVPSDERTTQLLAQESAKLSQVVNTLLIQQQKSSASCATLTQLQAHGLTITSSPLFDLNGKPTAGQWKIRYTATFCGQPVTRHILFTAGQGGIQAQSLMPGTTLANTQLSADVWQSFQAAAFKIVPGCQRIALKEVGVIQAPQSENALWRELWAARVCHQDVAQKITFYPTPQGTIFRMVVPRQVPGQPRPVSGTNPLR